MHNFNLSGVKGEISNQIVLADVHVAQMLRNINQTVLADLYVAQMLKNIVEIVLT